MKILFIHQQYQNGRGGEDIALNSEIFMMRKKYGQKNVRARIYPGKVNLNKFFFIIDLIFPIYTLLVLLYEKHRHNVKILHLHNIWPWLSPSYIVLAKLLRIKTVVTLHNYRSICLADNFFRDAQGVCTQCLKNRSGFTGVINRCYGGFLSSLAKYFVLLMWKFWGYPKFSDAVITLSNFQKEIFEESFSKKIGNTIRVKPNFIQSSDPPLEKDKKKRRSGFLFVGRLEKGKGIELLLKEWSDKGLSSNLNIVGKGPLEADLKKAYRHCDKIFFHGELAHFNVLEMMRQVKFVICPSLYFETFGLTIFEAYSQGTPVIGFDIGTRSEFIKNGYTGIITTPERLGLTLLKYDEASNNYHKYSSNCKEFMNKFSNEKTFNMQNQIYKKLMTG